MLTKTSAESKNRMDKIVQYINKDKEVNLEILEQF